MKKAGKIIEGTTLGLIFAAVVWAGLRQHDFSRVLFRGKRRIKEEE